MSKGLKNDTCTGFYNSKRLILQDVMKSDGIKSFSEVKELKLNSVKPRSYS